MLWWTLQQLKSSKPEVRIEAARKLGDSKEKKAVPALIRRLGDENQEVRLAAVRALEAIAHPAAAEPLASALENLPKLAKSRQADADKLLTQEEYEALSGALGALGPPAAAPMLKLLRSDARESRRWAAEALGRIGDPRAVDPLAGRLDDNRSEVRKAAALALGRIGNGRAVKPLMKALTNRDPETRRAAAEALGALRAEEAVDALGRAASDSTEAVQLAAVHALGAVGGLRAAALLRSVLDGGKKSVQDAAATALGEMDLSSADPEERARISVILNDFGGAVKEGEAAVAALLEALGSQDAARRRRAADALALIPSEKAVAPLLLALEDNDPGVQEASGRALARIGSDAVEGLSKALSSPTASVQREASRALGAIGEPKALRALAGLIKTNQRVTEAYPDALDAARSAADSIQAILHQPSHPVSDADLSLIAGLPDCLLARRDADGNPSEEVAIDCSALRDRAARELQRRGDSGSEKQ